jgi:hypothetical protein
MTEPETYTETCQSGFCEGFEVPLGDCGMNPKWVQRLVSVITDELGTTWDDLCVNCEDAIRGSGEYNEFNNW